ncbi:hypothetical protein SLEP1_g31676 [Rubroshorea leprosula]|uniref:RNase H type-1 domain-containing protein n=1 Tax=Rubroshorea leprosula TaxID=152421 RepID=A0AAV5KA68_9ROSI|nr:hypothetical protein SLEP1_g31676 [Rubroshorea leprosula]
MFCNWEHGGEWDLDLTYSFEMTSRLHRKGEALRLAALERKSSHKLSSLLSVAWLLRRECYYTKAEDQFSELMAIRLSRNHLALVEEQEQIGKAAAGGLIHDHNGRWVHGFVVNVGLTTSFLVELWGCRKGLKLANSLRIQQLVLEMDSLQAIRLIQNRQVSAGPDWVLLTDIFILIDSFSNCLVQHTLREGNSAANFMASMGHDLALGTTPFLTPPVDIHMILQNSKSVIFGAKIWMTLELFAWLIQ